VSAKDYPNSEPWTTADEHNLLIEIADDNRLRSIGIDPGAGPATTLVQVLRQLEEIDAEIAKQSRGTNNP
jgi:hypothetical protein